MKLIKLNCITAAPSETVFVIGLVNFMTMNTVGFLTQKRNIFLSPVFPFILADFNLFSSPSEMLSTNGKVSRFAHSQTDSAKPARHCPILNEGQFVDQEKQYDKFV